MSAEADAEAAEEAPEAEADADAASLSLPLSVILEPRLLTSMCLWNEHTIGIDNDNSAATISIRYDRPVSSLR